MILINKSELGKENVSKCKYIDIVIKSINYEFKEGSFILVDINDVKIGTLDLNKIEVRETHYKNEVTREVIGVKNNETVIRLDIKDFEFYKIEQEEDFIVMKCIK